MANNDTIGRPSPRVTQTLAAIKRLQRDRTHRDTQGTFFIEGVRNFIRVADCDLKIETILYSENLLIAPLARKLVRQLRRSGTPTVRVSPEQFRSISQTDRASGIGAIVKQHWLPLESTTPQAGLCWIVLDRIRSPGNFGTLIRTLEAVGGAGFILLDRSVDPFAPDTVRASMGALFHQKFIRTNSRLLQSWIQQHRGRTIGASPEGRQSFHQCHYPQATLLCLGEERKGLSDRQRAICDDLVSIPMVGQADSLNVAVAGSLLIYEVFRSRNGEGGIRTDDLSSSDRYLNS
ncbi:TrmH family RNA methyltransferase [Roseofilum casamattae]|uniref:RNA methyltransferase n=1 Tax=Roseofilum casamattae BLCC-M143 TaxID=3022442 RepID=A0ABT7C1Q7_9CYAN|nr:RNA methyltransferase [Roseofilum casamattae]MDJ1185381.1 RNA methyltransferase [Roseofilum casamattae BLCC-M143]